jgi:hypothetical protein
VTREEELPVYKVEIAGGIVVYVESMDQLRELVQTFSTNGAQANARTAPAPAIAETNPADGPEPKKTPKGAIYAPVEVKIRSANTQDALFKLYKGLDNLTQRETFRFLASKGERGASVEEMKEALKLPDRYKFSGLTAGIRRRAPHYGLKPEQVLIVEYRGIVANVRILDYRLGPEMLEMMRAQGLDDWKPKGEEREPKNGKQE